MKYNTQMERLTLPEYGRIIQEMVDHAVTITDRAERQCCAETIVKVMGNLTSAQKDTQEFEHKLWDHLARMSEYRLEIDYPYEIEKGAADPRPTEPLRYPDDNIRIRHYGRLLEELLGILSEMEEGDERDKLTVLAANQMKKSLSGWNGELVDDEKVVSDIARYTRGKIQLNLDDVQLAQTLPVRPAATSKSKATAGRTVRGKRTPRN